MKLLDLRLEDYSSVEYSPRDISGYVTRLEGVRERNQARLKNRERLASWALVGAALLFLSPELIAIARQLCSR